MKTTLMITIAVLTASPWPLREKLKTPTCEALADGPDSGQ